MYSSKIRMRDSLRSPFPSVKTRPQALFLGFPNVKARPQALFFICKRQNQAAMLFSGFPNILTWPQSLFFGFPSVTTRPQALFGGGVKCQNPAAGIFFFDCQPSEPGRRRFFWIPKCQNPAAGDFFSDFHASARPQALFLDFQASKSAAMVEP